jgi:hypothetical protein
MNRAAVVGLWAATAVAAFAVGRVAMPPQATPAPHDLGAEVRAALAEGDVLERFHRTAGLLQHLDPDNLPGVWAVYDSMIAILNEGELRLFIAAWARFDPLAALDHARAWPFTSKQEIGVEAAIYGWALRDPLAARLAIDGVVADQSRLAEKLHHGLVAGWVRSDAGAEGLDSHLADLPPAASDRLMVVAVATLMRARGAEAVMAWVDAILRNEAYDDAYKLSAFRRGIHSVSRWDPERGAAWATEHAGNAYAADAPRIVGENWGGRDGRAAMQWLRGQPAGRRRDQGVHLTFVEWLRADRQGAVEWLNSETLTRFHDPALELYASRLDDRKPEEAIVWCERIQNPKVRTSCRTAAAKTWYQNDAEAAEAWLEQSPLDEETRSLVRKLAERKKQSGRRRRPGGRPH